MTTYETKDSGQHLEYASGMRRDSQDGKPRFDLIRTKLQPYEEQMIYRYAMLLARGAEKYSARNWEDGCGEEELDRAKASLLRHTEQLVAGETDEDHAAAVWFNTQAIEYFRWRLEEPGSDGLTGRERLAKAARASEINRLALAKAQEMRRRERIREAAAELKDDHEFISSIIIPPGADYTYSTSDNTLTNNHTGEVMSMDDEPQPEEIEGFLRQRSDSAEALQLGLDRDQRSH